MTSPSKALCLSFILLYFSAGVASFAIESDQYRLLSISTSSKMILISQVPNKTKYLLDATTAKITVDGKPAEFSSLQAYTVIRVRFEARKSSKDGVEIDGVASEIKVSTPENKK